MQMVNLRWCKSGHSFPERIGNGKEWYLIYADVSQAIEYESFNKSFRALFFHMGRINWIMRNSVGDWAPPHEIRDANGKYEPW